MGRVNTIKNLWWFVNWINQRAQAHSLTFHLCLSLSVSQRCLADRWESLRRFCPPPPQKKKERSHYLIGDLWRFQKRFKYVFPI